jgi:hypothetical protein
MVSAAWWAPGQVAGGEGIQCVPGGDHAGVGERVVVRDRQAQGGRGGDEEPDGKTGMARGGFGDLAMHATSI